MLLYLQARWWRNINWMFQKHYPELERNYVTKFVDLRNVQNY